MDARSHAALCQEVESELRELCLECRKKFPIIKEYTERAILKVRHHREVATEQQAAAATAAAAGREAPAGAGTLPEFPLDEVLRAILMACETFQNKIVLLSLSCLQRLIHRRVLKDETVAIVINLMKEQATNGDDSVQLKVLQTIMATPAHMTLLNELVVEQLLQLLYVLHNSSSPSVHHTACAGLRRLAEPLSARAAAAEARGAPPEHGAGAASAAAAPGGAARPAQAGGGTAAGGGSVEGVRPVIRQSAAAAMPSVTPSQAPPNLPLPLRMFFVFVQDLCVMADYDVSSLSSRYALDAGERMRTGSREGFWLAQVKFPRPLCLELLGTCVAAHPDVFVRVPECFTLLRHNICAALLKNLRSCYDFAILIRCIHVLQQILQCPSLASQLMPEITVFLHLMMDLTTAERSPWQRATSLEFLRSVCENPASLGVLYEHAGGREAASPSPSTPQSAASGPKTFLELVNTLSKLIHQVCFSSGLDSGALLQSAAGGGSTSSAAAAGLQRSTSSDGGRGLLQGMPAWGLGLGPVGFTGLEGELGTGEQVSGGNSNTDALGSGGGSSGGTASRHRQPAKRVQLLSMMSETEPPVIQPSFLVSLVVESVFAIVSTMYRLLLDACSEAETADSGPTSSAASSAVGSEGMAMPRNSSGSLTPLTGQLTADQERCQDMVADCWASLLSALLLLLHGSVDEQCLQQALRCMQTLLYCCSRLGLEQARDACLLQLTRYALPGFGHETEPEAVGWAAAYNTSTSGGLSPKNLLCFKALLHFCYCFGGLLGVAGWSIAIRALNCLERSLQKAPRAQSELTVMRQALDSLFGGTAQLPLEALGDVIDAMGLAMRGAAAEPAGAGAQTPKGAAPSSSSESDEGVVVLSRLVELCTYNLDRLPAVWDRVLRIITGVCTSEDKDGRSDLRGAAAAALCRILAQALRRGAVAFSERPETAQEGLLHHLEVLLRAPHEEVRARVCEGLLSILQASGQELHPEAWRTMIHLVATAARVELEKEGLEFFLPKAMDPLMAAEAEVMDEGTRPLIHQAGGVSATGGPDVAGRGPPSVLPTVFQVLELLVNDFMQHIPPASVPRLTASIGAFARFMGLSVNSSLTAVGFLWKIADALAHYHIAPPEEVSVLPLSTDPRVTFEELWVQLFMHLRVIAVDRRPEVRNCAVKSLTSALLSHGKKVGVACYQRCLRDILIEVLAEIQGAAKAARSKDRPGSREGLIVHHSRDTPQKQWDETMVLGVEGVRRVLSNFAEEAGVTAFAPLAYTLLLQVQATLRDLTSEVSGSALRTLVDLMRIPASAQLFEVSGTLPVSPLLPVPSEGAVSVWQLGWSVLWGMVSVCTAQEVPEPLMETFATALNALRNSHRHLFRPAQHVVLLQIALALVTAPSFYLPSCPPLRLEDSVLLEDVQDLEGKLSSAVKACSQAARGDQRSVRAFDDEVFKFVSASPQELWTLDGRTKSSSQKTYVKPAAAVSCVVDANQSRNLEIKSVGAVLKEICREASPADELSQSFLGPSQSPTHRTMLHISSARLQHVQGFAFGILEETQGFELPALEVLFLFQCCAVFLDVRRVLLDTNKIALAARTLCLLVAFCRRVLLQNLTRQSSSEIASLHLRALLGEAMPHLLKALAALVCGTGNPKLHGSGLWKLALEAMVYLIEDSLPAAAEQGRLSPESASAYWAAVCASLAEIMASKRLMISGAAAEQDVELLARVVGNLIARRLLVCTAVPSDFTSRAVGFLEELDGLQSKRPGLRGAPLRGPRADCATLGHLFDLCARPEDQWAAAGAAGGGGGGGGSGGEDTGCSVAALSARGQPAVPGAGAGGQAPAPALPNRMELLNAVVPALLARVRATFSAFLEEEAAGAASPQRAEEVCSVLARLAALRVDAQLAAAAAPAAPGRARAACELAGARGCTMALLPQLASLATSGDASVRQGVSAALLSLASELGLGL